MLIQVLQMNLQHKILLHSVTQTVFLLIGDSQALKHGLNSESGSEDNLCAIWHPTPTRLCVYIKHKRMEKSF